VTPDDATPAPAALSLDEVLDALVAVIRVANTAALACAGLTERTPKTGQAAVWLAAPGGGIDRVVDISEFRVIPGTSAVNEHSIQFSLPLDANADELVDAPSARRTAVRLLDELLERSGRRGTAARLATLGRSTPGS